MTTATYELSHLELLEAEAVHIFREVAATQEKPSIALANLGRIAPRDVR